MSTRILPPFSLPVHFQKFTNARKYFFPLLTDPVLPEHLVSLQAVLLDRYGFEYPPAAQGNIWTTLRAWSRIVKTHDSCLIVVPPGITPDEPSRQELADILLGFRSKNMIVIAPSSQLIPRAAAPVSDTHTSARWQLQTEADDTWDEMLTALTQVLDQHREPVLPLSALITAVTQAATSTCLSPLDTPPANGAFVLFRRQDEADDWALARRRRPAGPDMIAYKIADYEYFLSRWPAGQYAEDAREMLDMLQDETAWESAEKTHTLTGYQQYLTTYPSGFHAREAQQNLLHLTQQQAWELARKQHTAAGYTAYINQYPDSPFVSAAENALEDLHQAAHQTQEVPEPPPAIAQPVPPAPVQRANQQISQAAEWAIWLDRIRELEAELPRNPVPACWDELRHAFESAAPLAPDTRAADMLTRRYAKAAEAFAAYQAAERQIIRRPSTQVVPTHPSQHPDRPLRRPVSPYLLYGIGLGSCLLMLVWIASARNTRPAVSESQMAMITSEADTVYMPDSTLTDTARMIYLGGYREGVARYLENGLIGFVLPSGARLTEARYTQASDFSNGLALVQRNGLLGYIDRSGAEVIPPQFEKGGSFDSTQTAHVWLNGREITINADGVCTNCTDTLGTAAAAALVMEPVDPSLVTVPAASLEVVPATAGPVPAQANPMSAAARGAQVSPVPAAALIPSSTEIVMADTEPRLTNFEKIRRQIKYPQSARDQDLQGTVVARILVGPSGNYVRHEIISNTPAILNDAVHAFLPRLTFTPARREGQPIYYWVNVPFPFKLSD
ncbi:MAG: energy transducer TonB [Bacteroidia bacterium]|nr:energy transducer TonB [Bacteroidia bacterium]